MAIINAAGVDMSTPSRPRGYNEESRAEELIVNAGPRYSSESGDIAHNPFDTTPSRSAPTSHTRNNTSTTPAASPTKRTKTHQQLPDNQLPEQAPLTGFGSNDTYPDKLLHINQQPNDNSLEDSSNQTQEVDSPSSPNSSSNDLEGEDIEELYRRFAINCARIETVRLPAGQLFDIPIMKKPKSSKSTKGSSVAVRGGRPATKSSKVVESEVDKGEVAQSDDNTMTADGEAASSQNEFPSYAEGYELTVEDWDEGVKRDLDKIDQQLPTGPVPPPYRNPQADADPLKGRDVYVPVQRAAPPGSSGVGRWEYANTAGAAMDLWIADLASKTDNIKLLEIYAWMIRTRQANDIPRRLVRVMRGQNPSEGVIIRTRDVDMNGELINGGYSQMDDWDWMIEDAKDKRKFMKSEKKWYLNTAWGIAEEAKEYHDYLVASRGRFEEDQDGEHKLAGKMVTDGKGRESMTKDIALGYRRTHTDSLWYVVLEDASDSGEDNAEAGVQGEDDAEAGTRDEDEAEVDAQDKPDAGSQALL